MKRSIESIWAIRVLPVPVGRIARVSCWEAVSKIDCWYCRGVMESSFILIRKVSSIRVWWFHAKLQHPSDAAFRMEPFFLIIKRVLGMGINSLYCICLYEEMFRS